MSRMALMTREPTQNAGKMNFQKGVEDADNLLLIFAISSAAKRPAAPAAPFQPSREAP
jgi:hypothetical protein